MLFTKPCYGLCLATLTFITSSGFASEVVISEAVFPLLNDDPIIAEIEYTDRILTDNWGLAIGLRHAQIPFATEDQDVDDIIPLLYFENEYLYIKGLEAGLHLWLHDNHQINLYSRFRFVDIPKEFQNEVQADAFDLGFQYRFTHEKWESDLAITSDGNKRFYGYARSQYQWQNGDWQLTPYAELQWKSEDFNQHYYGLDIENPGSGFTFSAGMKARYHVTSNLYLIGNLGITRLEDDVYDLSIIDSQYQWESFFGFGFFPDPTHPVNHQVKKESGEYLRLAHGWATPSNLNAILKGNTESDPYNNQLTSIFYGIPVTDSIFNLPIDLYFTVGGMWHHDSEVQNNLAEGVVGFKAYYTFEFGPRWRLGAAEGLSYVSNVTHIEGTELDEKEYRPSKLLNYLDISFDVNVGDIFKQHSMRNLWLGYSIHHRSGIFETSSAFGRIKGGSNYNTVYLQWHF